MLELAAGAALLGSLAVYAVTGGADFGGGVWDLLASGPRAARQREVIARAIAPIWEANHVWLIAAIVILFTAFPTAFAALCTALHLPLLVMLLGIVARGSAFTFRAFGAPGLWSLVFSIASVVTPLALGTTVGAAVSGAVRAGESGAAVFPGIFGPWLAPFPLALGVFTLALFAYLAAVYLCLETPERELREDFRARALACGVVCGALAWLCLWLAGSGAPVIRAGLARAGWPVVFHLATGGCALAALAALWTRRYAAARPLAAAQVALVVLGWGLAQYPYVVYPDLTLAGAAAPASVLRPVIAGLAGGALLVVPAFVWLFWVFKRP